MLRQTDNGDDARQVDTLRILAVADQVETQLYGGSKLDWLLPIDLLISCGDLPPYYLDYLVSTLNTSLVHVPGNHCYVAHDPITKRCDPGAYPGAHNLHGKVTTFRGTSHSAPPLLLAGLEGSPLYKGGPHQYTEAQVALTLSRLAPGLLINKARTGRYLDIMVTHAPPRGIHDNNDLAHKGFTSLLPFIRRFKPAFLLHGHTHRYNHALPVRSTYAETAIINVYGHALLELTYDGKRWRQAERVTSDERI